jgi:hypothetical protein
MHNKQVCCDLSRAHGEGADICAGAVRRLNS